jgi:2-methylcitrate dehydratase PrpD
MTMTSEMSEALEARVDKAAAVDWAALTADSQDATRRLVFDALGIASAGRYAPGVDAAIGALADAAGPGDVRVPWVDMSLPVADAAMALSWLIHAWDFDDTHDAGVLHTAALAVAAAHATAVREAAPGQLFLEGVVARFPARRHPVVRAGLPRRRGRGFARARPQPRADAVSARPGRPVRDVADQQAGSGRRR